MTPQGLQNANKFVYLAKAYPEKDVPGLLGLFRLSPIDMNCAIWYALELKWIEIEDRKEMRPILDKKGQPTGEQEVELQYVKVVGQPDTWGFGEAEEYLEDSLVYAFGKLNAEEKDLEENYLGNWLAGYAPQDTLIAVKHLLEDGVLHEYQIEDGDNSYIFYTLKANVGKNWGAKQFKVNPLTDEPNEAEQPKKAAEGEVL